jgi:hypothetical protein
MLNLLLLLLLLRPSPFLQNPAGARQACKCASHAATQLTPNCLLAAAAVSLMQVPAKLVSVPIMPRLPNGKIDAKSLAEPEWGAVPGGAGSDGDGEAAAPSTDMEELLADIWAAELKVSNCLTFPDIL